MSDGPLRITREGAVMEVALYRPPAAAPLAAAVEADAGVPLRAAVEALDPAVIDVSVPEPFFNVNTEEDLARAEALLGASRT